MSERRSRGHAISAWTMGVAALALAVGSVMHLAALPVARSALDGVAIQPFFRQAFLALWANDSAVTATAAAGCAWLAYRPFELRSALPFLLIALCLCTSVVLFAFLGGFFAGFIFLFATLAIGLALALERRPTRTSVEL